MNKKLKAFILTLLVLTLCLSIFACGKKDSSESDSVTDSVNSSVEDEYITVSFDSNGGSSIKDQKIRKGRTCYQPSDPTKQGYMFDIWTLNDEEFSFDSTLESNTVLKALWGAYEARLGVSIDVFAGIDMSGITVKNAEKVVVNNAIVVDGESFGFTNEGEYFFYNGETEIGHYVVSPFSITASDFDRKNELNYGEFTIGGVTKEMFKWSSAVYQPIMLMNDASFEIMKNYCAVNGYTGIRIDMYAILQSNNLKIVDSYFANNQWTAGTFRINSLNELRIWSPSEGSTEVYFSISFVKDALYCNDFDNAASIISEEVGDKNGEYLVIYSRQYQPHLIMKADSLASIKEYAAANGYTKLKLNFYCIINENSICINSSDWFVPNEWNEKEYVIADLTVLDIWCQGSGLTSFYYYAEYVI